MNRGTSKPVAGRLMIDKPARGSAVRGQVDRDRGEWLADE